VTFQGEDVTDPNQPAPNPFAAPGYAPAPYGPPAAQPGGYPPYGWAQPAAPVQRSRRMGVTALVLAAAVFVLSIVASVVVGMAAGPLATRTSTSFNFNTANLTEAQAEAFAPAGALMGLQLLLGTAIGITALVLGIVAVATKRGRPFGIVAIVLAGAAPIVSFVVYGATLVATLPPA